MNLLFYMRDASAAEWLHDLARALPQASLREWQPGDDAPADFVLVWRPPRELFAPRDGLRAVFNLGAGVDAILALEYAHPGTLRPDVPLVRLEDSGMAQQMIEYVTYAVLRYLRRFDDYAQLQAQCRWQELPPYPREHFTVGVLGLGVLGAQVAQALAALGLPVRGFSRHARPLEGVTTYAGAEQFDAFLQDLQVLVNLLPHTPATRGVLNAHTFAQLAPGARLVNVARGAHLVDADLLAALETGQLSAATLDVFNQEPLADDHPFWRNPRITLTPHCSAQTLRSEAIEQITQKINALMRGEAISGVVDPASGY
ncbi:glyoxylate/hydroxypyruvate reductase A [Paraburkholderia bonniea]|uniref:2-hydroxyacid dehydrogenase n=1 Tax=Paraburkholderia bonniea TaxID=2152891 RepID=UPI002572AC19|nr:glyoxylate/hydroxypyruvate reductase A [Paraburkholderia bonniea]WJF90281.1 glyoxylate/hydroxypyruvate reductase A [Paraburkholderia bonniea]WJF93596.1 glyoxylate/hydroxypyruvate reductase A [Paraburkholderia bonniea]